MGLKNITLIRIFGLVALFTTVSTLSAQNSPQSNDPRTTALSRMLQHLPRVETNSRSRLSTHRPESAEEAVIAMDSNSPILLPPLTYDTSGDWSVAIADVNNDGIPDLVIGNQRGINGGSIGIMLGNGDGTFQNEVNYDSGGYDYYAGQAVVADVNGDGKPDVIVANGGEANGYGASVGVLLGNGDGTFQAAVTYGSGGNPSSVVVADLNGDGKPDIVVGNCCSQTPVGVLLGNGDGTFKASVLYSSLGSFVNWVSVADINGDSRPDILVASGGGVSILVGNGDGTFQPFVTAALSNFQPYSVVGTDLNGDGRADLIVGGNICVAGNCESGAVDVLLGNGNGTFQPAVTYSFGLFAGQVIVGDLNVDGKTDLLVTAACDNSCPGGGAVGVLLGNGGGTFQPAMTYSSGGGALALALADLNGDEKPDVVVANSGSVAILMNNLGPHSSTTTVLVSTPNPANHHQDVSYTATVTSQSGKNVTRTVTFQDGGVPTITIPLVDNQATFTTSYKKSGAHTITATYVGDAENAASTSSPLVEYIELLPLVTHTLLTTSGSPSHVGQSVTFKAMIMWSFGTVPDGELVTFYDSTTMLGSSITVGGMASYATAALSRKSHFIKAVYAGDATFKPSIGSLRQVVEP